MHESRHALKIIFTTLQYLSTQGLAIRGNTEESSNFRRLLELRATDSPILKNSLARKEKYEWLSPEISNEILELMAHALRKLILEVKSSQFFGVILDETADISCREKITICFRNVTLWTLKKVFLSH